MDIVDILITVNTGVFAIISGVLILRREIRNKTLDKCEQFQKEIIPEYLEIIKYHKDNNINIIGQIYIRDGMIVKPIIEPSQEMVNFFEQVMLLFNHMDSFAAYFIDNMVAEEKVACKLQGKAFCDIVNELKAVYDLFMITHKKDYFSLTTIYEKWHQMRD